jgi:hypothetical protein
MIGLDLGDLAIDGCITKPLRRPAHRAQPGGPRLRQRQDPQVDHLAIPMIWWIVSG